jgi:hypothetical protein
MAKDRENIIRDKLGRIKSKIKKEPSIYDDMLPLEDHDHPPPAREMDECEQEGKIRVKSYCRKKPSKRK